jgi:hypothetical protein
VLKHKTKARLNPENLQTWHYGRGLKYRAQQLLERFAFAEQLRKETWIVPS